MTPEERIRQLACFLYPEPCDPIFHRILDRVNQFRQQHPQLRQQTAAGPPLSEKDALLITYADQFQMEGERPLQTQARFLKTHLAGLVSGVHILPFFPYSSDDGFSVIDYRRVNPAWGDWQDVQALGKSFRLMFDAVVNHVSRESDWFRRFLAGDPEVAQDFIIVSAEQDLSQVVRPRTLPLLTPVDAIQGRVQVWTTFSDDQIDLNYTSPHVLLEMVDLLLFYVAQGADLIRLDAIAYLWKEPGTSCIHLPQTHAVVKLFRAVLDAAAQGVLLITETNVPHEENIRYFGSLLPGKKATDEAQLVYQFPLAPLVLHSFHCGSAAALTAWLEALQPPPPGAAFFNFLASHDGIGVRPAEGLLSPQQIQELANITLEHGGRVSYRTNPDGSYSPYELNITWFDALNDPRDPIQKRDVARFLASQVIMLSLAGVPGIYVHSLFGSRNCQICREQTGRDRSLNREKFLADRLESELDDPSSLKAQVFSGCRRLLAVRREQAAFHPEGAQRVLPAPQEVFALLRLSPDGQHPLICLVNVTGDSKALSIDLNESGLLRGEWKDLLGGASLDGTRGALEIDLPAYGAAWLSPRL